MAGLIKYGDQPEKYENHVLIFDGMKSGSDIESKKAHLLYEFLMLKGVNPVIYSGNDTLNFETMKVVVFINKEDNDTLKEKCRERKIPVFTLKKDRNKHTIYNQIKSYLQNTN